VSRRIARWLYVAALVAVSIFTLMLLTGGLAARSFAGAVMLCFVGLVAVAWLTGRPKSLADGFTRRFPADTRDAYMARQERLGRSRQVTGLPPLITVLPLSTDDQLELMGLADQLRRARRRFRAGPIVRGRLLLVGDDAPGKSQLEEAMAHRAQSPLLRMDWTDWDPEGDWTTAFDEAFSMARKRRDGVIVMNGGTRFSHDEAARLAAVIDVIDWPLILIFAAEQQHDLERAITARLTRTIRLQAPPGR
jgi:hypothetical protein